MTRYITGFLFVIISTTLMAGENRFSAGANVNFTHVPGKDIRLDTSTNIGKTGLGGACFALSAVSSSASQGEKHE